MVTNISLVIRLRCLAIVFSHTWMSLATIFSLSLRSAGMGQKNSSVQKAYWCFQHTLNCCWTRISIKQKVLNKTSNNLVITRLATTWVEDQHNVTPYYVLSLPKPCCFKAGTLFKSGNLCINKIFQIIESNSELVWKKQWCFSPAWFCTRLEKS